MIRPRYKGGKRWNAYNEHEKEYPRTEAQGLEAYHLSSVWAAVLGKRTGTTVLEKGQNPESALYRMRVRREVNGVVDNIYNRIPCRNNYFRILGIEKRGEEP